MPYIVIRAFTHLIVRHPCKARVTFSIIRKGIRVSLRLTVPRPPSKKKGAE